MRKKKLEVFFIMHYKKKVEMLRIKLKNNVENKVDLLGL